MKRIALILLSLAMIVSSLVIVPVSATTAETETETAFTPIADKDKLTVEGLKADGKTVLTMDEYYTLATTDGATAGSYVAISSTDDWKIFDNVCSSKGAWTNKSSGVTFFLTGDLDFTGVTGVTPVGIKYPYWNEKTEEDTTDFDFGLQEFQGTFDGNGYTIKNLDIVEEASKVGATSAYRGSNIGMGLFAIAKNATFKNLIIDDTCSFVQVDGDSLGGYCGAGALLGINSGNVVIDNVWNKGTVIGGVHAGGILGNMGATATITNCTNDGDIKGANSKGGIVGWVGTATIDNCVNNGTIYGGGAGGIMGRTRGNAVATNCVNNGVLLGTGDKVSGICAAVEQGYSVKLENCVNNAYFNLNHFKTADTTKCIKGIINYAGSATMAEKVTVTNCTSVFDNLTEADYASIIPTAGYDLLRIGAFATWGTNVVDLENFDINATVAVEEKDEAGETVTVNKKVYDVTSYFKVMSPEGLVKLSELVAAGTNFKGKHVFLGMDIDMTGYDFEPIGFYTAEAAKSYNVIGTVSAAFSGTFDGQGHTIEGLNLTYSNTERSDCGLFGYLVSATVKNVVIGASCSFEMTGDDGYCGTGSIAGRNQGSTITNCASYALVTAPANTGGMAGREGTFTYCSFNGTARSTIYNGGAVAGMCGFGAAKADYCVNNGYVIGNSAAGICRATTITVTGSVNNGVVVGGAQAAGIIASRGSVTLNDCANYGSVATNRGQVVHANGKLHMSNLAAPEAGRGDASTTFTFNNCIDEPYVGYSEDKIITPDLDFVVDIKDLFEITTKDDVTAVTPVSGTDYATTKVIKISDVEGWRLFSAMINTYDTTKGWGKVFYLTSDLDFSGYSFDFNDLVLADAKHIAPVGFALTTGDGGVADANGFAGSFNGLGHTIYNLTLNGGHIYKNESGGNSVYGDGYLGLFSGVCRGLVSNVVIDDSYKIAAGTGILIFNF